MTTYQRCGVRIYAPRRRWCWRCSDAAKQEQAASRWRALSPEDREELRQVNRIKYAADRPERVCCRCRAPLQGTWAATCDHCCGKRKLQKRLAERARRARLKGET